MLYNDDFIKLQEINSLNKDDVKKDENETEEKATMSQMDSVPSM
jgi:hypothetical protein